MQQGLDLLIFLLSNIVLIYWCVLVFRHKAKSTLFLNLNEKQILILVIVEIVLFAVLYLNYELYKSEEFADSFAWHYSIIYARGVLPIAGLSVLNDKLFGSGEPVFVTLLMALIFDYVILLTCTVISNIIRQIASK